MSAPPRARRVVIGLLMLWSFTQILGGLELDVTLVRLLRPVKTFIGPACVVAIWALSRKSTRVAGPLQVLLVFAMFAGIGALARPDPHILVGLMYIGWGFALFVVLPQALSPPGMLRAFVRWNTLSMVAGIVVAGIVVVGSGVDLTTVGAAGRIRYSMGMNPQYAANISATLVLGTVALLVVFEERRFRLILWILAILAAYATILTDARTQVLFLLVFGTVFCLQLPGFLRLISLFTGLAGTIVGVLLFIDVTSSVHYSGSLDTLSSGRLSLWRAMLAYNFPTDDPASALLGNGLTQWPRNVWESGGRVPILGHMDNVYLDTLFSSGAIGLLLLVLAITVWFARVRPARSGAEGRRAAYFVRAVIAAMSVAALTMSIFPSFGNLFNAHVLVIATTLTTRLSQQAMARSRAGAPAALGRAGRVPGLGQPERLFRRSEKAR